MAESPAVRRQQLMQQQMLQQQQMQEQQQAQMQMRQQQQQQPSFQQYQQQQQMSPQQYQQYQQQQLLQQQQQQQQETPQQQPAYLYQQPAPAAPPAPPTESKGSGKGSGKSVPAPSRPPSTEPHHKSNQLALRTFLGPVPFRPRRQQVRFVVDGVGREIGVSKHWLKGQDPNNGVYQKCVKQAMLIAAQQYKLFDAEDPQSRVPVQEVERATARMRSLMAGQERIPTSGSKKKSLVNVAAGEMRERDKLVKFSKNCCVAGCGSKMKRRERSFVIDNGKLQIFYYKTKGAKLKDDVELKDATCFHETRANAQIPRWEPEYAERLRVDVQTRIAANKPPLYLYSKSPEKILRWKRAFALAKVLVSENDRRALKVSIGRATSQGLIKAWEALSRYFSELRSTRDTVKQMAMRLMKVEVSRGWTKMKLLYKSKVEEAKRREEQRTWAARFMSEKLAKLGDMNARSAADVRENMITRIQQRFRRYREDKILERAYPLGPEMMSRLQQAKLGRTVDFDMRAIGGDDAVRLCLSKETINEWEKSKELLRAGIKATYSEVNEPLSNVTLFVADNLSSLCFSAQSGEKDSFSALGKADWSKYINMDRISSIVLNTAPVVAQIKREHHKGDEGCWLAINGPRICWDKKLDGKGICSGDKEGNGFSVPQRLANNQKVKWLCVKVEKAEAQLSQSGSGLWARVHFMGYSWKSEIIREAHIDFAKGQHFEVSIPVASDDFQTPQSAVAAVEVYRVDEISDEADPKHERTKLIHTLLHVGSAPVEHIFRGLTESANPGAPARSDVGIELGTPPFGADTTLLDHYLNLTLSVHLTEDKVSPMAKVEDQAETRQMVSPELMGSGVITSLYTSHAQAWYDPELGVSKFRVANFVELSLGTLRFPPTFAPDEKTLKKYRIRIKMGGVCMESVALHRPEGQWAKILGPLYGDPNAVRFGGSKLFLPLPPGCWSQKEIKDGQKTKKLPEILVEVMEIADVLKGKQPSQGMFSHVRNAANIPGLEAEPCDYKEFLENSSVHMKEQAKRAKEFKEEKVFHAKLTFDHLTPDRVKTVSCYMNKVEVKKPPPAKGQQQPPADQTQGQDEESQPWTTLVHANMAKIEDADAGAEDECLMSLDFSIRDRDYVRGMLGEPSQKQALCVGDKAMLTLAEPFVYPETDLEFRRRFCPGPWKRKEDRHGDPWKDRGCELRPPCLSSEYAESGLGDLVPKEPFKQSFIPSFCQDIVPHTFIVPLTEKEFLDRGLPGFYPDIMRDFIQHNDAEVRSSNLGGGGGARAGATRRLPKPICRFLKEMNRQAPVTVLCLYADGTCDVEIAQDFLNHWKENPSRRLRMPGYLEKYQEKASTNPEDEKKESPTRCVLKRVPTALVRAVHFSGINVYDSGYRSTMDAIKGPMPLNEFNPKTSLEKLRQAKTDSFVLPAGPLPPDATEAACQYEWVIRIRAQNQTDMYSMAAMLRRCQRLDHYQQAYKMVEYRNKITDQPKQQQQPMYTKPIAGGQLDVLLLEARRLMPSQNIIKKVLHADLSNISLQNLANPASLAQTTHPLRTDLPLDTQFFQDSKATASTLVRPSTPAGTSIHTFVNFRLLHNRGEVLPYRGQRVQQSSMVGGTDSPNWSTVDSLKRNGGYLFRSGTIDPERHPDLSIDFEVRRALYGFSTHIGGIQLPVTQRKFLINPSEPFKNLWLPLVTVQEGKLVANPTGEIHIMTRWLPAEKIQILADGSQKQQLSVRQHFLKELWPKICAQRIKEPIYNIEAQYLHYNPNLIKPTEPGDPEAEPYKDFVRRHCEELANAVPYLECLERRQTQAWDEFERQLDEEQPGVRLAERRLMWHESESTEKLQTLRELVQGGIPSNRRERLWQELTLASRVREKDVGAGADGAVAVQASEQEYQRLLERGVCQTSDAMKQLREDAYNMSQWYSSVPPIMKVRDLHLDRIRRAENVVAAILAAPDGDIAYCESLLVLAFFLLLPQGCKEEQVAGDGGYSYLSESSAFWMLYTLISHPVNGAYRHYYGVPPRKTHDEAQNPPVTLCAGSGAMQDCFLLDCCLAWHEPDLWKKMNALGFFVPSVFYGAFMRLFATYMPTATVFRFWDLLFSQSTDDKAQPHARSHLVDLAFGVVKCKGKEIMAANSATEIRDIILSCLGSIYDTSSVIDLTMLSHQQLWFGSGFSSGKVWSLHTQREDLFKNVNMTITEQNEILKSLTHILPLKFNQGYTGPQQNVAGVTVKELLSEVLGVLSQSLENMSKKNRTAATMTDAKKTWGMHRPMPLANHELAASVFEKMMHTFQKQLQSLQVQNPDPLPFKVRAPMVFFDQVRRPKILMNTPFPGLEPVNLAASDLASVLERDLPSWSKHATALWNAFSKNRHMSAYMNSGAYGTGHIERYGYDAQDPKKGLLENDAEQNKYDNPYIDPNNPYAPRQTAMNRMLLSVTKFFGIQHRDAWQEGLWGRASAPNQEMDLEIFSLNELFIALICSARGTVGEKASALFNIYSYNDPRYVGIVHHVTPVSKLAKSVANIAAEGGMDALGRTLAPPDPESDAAKLNNVLRLEIWTNYPNGARRMGDVLVPTLASFISFSGQESSPPISWNIWGDPTAWKQGARVKAAPAGSQPQGFDASQLTCLGELNMSISWTPLSIRKVEEGQLMIHVHYIRFYSMYVSDFYKVNPWIQVSMSTPDMRTNGDHNNWTPINRWDPRRLIGSSSAKSMITTVGAYGGDIKFDMTMRDDWLKKTGEKFHGRLREAKGMGYDQNTHHWQWNETWGKQFSVERLQVLPQFVKLANRKNVLDMQGVRFIVSGILQRCMLNMSNRQAALIAESMFNRNGAVPGIRKAILAPLESADKKVYKTWPELEKAMNDGLVVYRDMTDLIVLEHEKQVAMNGGLINMFSEDWLTGSDGVYNPVDYGLAKMHIEDPFPKYEKVLYVYFNRGGDGERCMKAVYLEKNGVLKKPSDNYHPEVEMEQINIWPQTKVTKEEFISCFLNSPMLSESLRRLGSCDHVLHQKRPIPLDVTIMDPRREEEEDALNDVFDVQQSVLLEVWDSDAVKRDFLGECWLPPLATLGKRPRDLVLPLQKADFSEDAINGGTRPEPSKDLGDDVKDPNKKITGHLYVSVTWDFPIWKDISQENDMKEWLEANGVPDLNGKNQKRVDELANMGVTTVKALGDAWDRDNKLLNKIFDRSQEASTLKFSSAEQKNIIEYFKAHYGEEIHLRAVQQERMHTGNLTIRLKEAKMLRLADYRIGRTCDPQVHAWLRNDHLGAWLKKKLFASSTKMNNRNPVWNTDHGPFPILTGSYQARYKMPEAGFMSEVNKQLLNFQPKKKRHMQEDRDIAFVKRFGRDGLRVKFVEQLPSQPSGQPGENHRVEVVAGDTIREFKVKLTAACEAESNFWKGRSEEFTKSFADIAIGFKHLVMVFIPSPKVQKLLKQRLTNSDEYKRQYNMDLADPSNWQPLDPARSFSQYSQFNFGRVPVMLRVVEETPTYKAQNLRYKLFAEEQNQLTYLDRNEPKVCFGWAKYKHQEGSTEWRQAFISKISDKDRPWKATWVQDWCLEEETALERGPGPEAAALLQTAEEVEEPKEKDPKDDDTKNPDGTDKDPAAAAAAAAAKAPPAKKAPPTGKDLEKALADQAEARKKPQLERKQVLLQPRLPLVDDVVNEDHEEILKQALTLRQSGMSDWEIEGVLNQLLKDSPDRKSAGADGEDVITLDEIRSYLQRQDATKGQ